MTDMVPVGEFGLTGEMVQLIKDTIAKEATDTELALFIQQCNRTQLDPFAKQIHLVPRWDSKLGREVRTTQISIDGMRLVAQRSQEYAGQTPTYWCGKDGQWTDVWLSSNYPEAAKIGVYRAGFAEATWAVATWSQYAVYIKPRGKDAYLSPFWAKMPSHMLGKCAEALALRKSFPMELSGLYIPEEMGADETPKRRRQKSTPAPARSGETVTRSAPTVTEELASEDDMNALDERLHDLSEGQKVVVTEWWKDANLPPIDKLITLRNVERANSLIDAALLSMRPLEFASEQEQYG